MKVSPKCYIISLDTYKRISPYFNTYERAAAWKKKHHVFGIIVDIKKTLDKNKKNKKSYCCDCDICDKGDCLVWYCNKHKEEN